MTLKIKDNDIIVSTKKGEISFFKMYQDLDKKVNEVSLVGWLSIAIAVLAVVPATLSQITLYEIKEQNVKFQEQNVKFQEQNVKFQEQQKELVDLKLKINTLEEQIKHKRNN
jgi:hypothetical protein